MSHRAALSGVRAAIRQARKPQYAIRKPVVPFFIQNRALHVTAARASDENTPLNPPNGALKSETSASIGSQKAPDATISSETENSSEAADQTASAGTSEVAQSTKPEETSETDSFSQSSEISESADFSENGKPEEVQAETSSETVAETETPSETVAQPEAQTETVSKSEAQTPLGSELEAALDSSEELSSFPPDPIREKKADLRRCVVVSNIGPMTSREELEDHFSFLDGFERLIPLVNSVDGLETGFAVIEFTDPRKAQRFLRGRKEGLNRFKSRYLVFSDPMYTGFITRRFVPESWRQTNRVLMSFVRNSSQPMAPEDVKTSLEPLFNALRIFEAPIIQNSGVFTVYKPSGSQYLNLSVKFRSTKQAHLFTLLLSTLPKLIPGWNFRSVKMAMHLRENPIVLGLLKESQSYSSLADHRFRVVGVPQEFADHEPSDAVVVGPFKSPLTPQDAIGELLALLNQYALPRSIRNTVMLNDKLVVGMDSPEATAALLEALKEAGEKSDEPNGVKPSEMTSDGQLAIPVEIAGQQVSITAFRFQEELTAEQIDAIISGDKTTTANLVQQNTPPCEKIMVVNFGGMDVEKLEKFASEQPGFVSMYIPRKAVLSVVDLQGPMRYSYVFLTFDNTSHAADALVALNNYGMHGQRFIAKFAHRYANEGTTTDGLGDPSAVNWVKVKSEDTIQHLKDELREMIVEAVQMELGIDRSEVQYVPIVKITPSSFLVKMPSKEYRQAFEKALWDEKLDAMRPIELQSYKLVLYGFQDFSKPSASVTIKGLLPRTLPTDVEEFVKRYTDKSFVFNGFPVTVSGLSKGFAFILFENEEAAKEFIEAFNKEVRECGKQPPGQILNSDVVVMFADSPLLEDGPNLEQQIARKATRKVVLNGLIEEDTPDSVKEAILPYLPTNSRTNKPIIPDIQVPRFPNGMSKRLATLVFPQTQHAAYFLRHFIPAGSAIDGHRVVPIMGRIQDNEQ